MAKEEKYTYVFSTGSAIILGLSVVFLSLLFCATYYLSQPTEVEGKLACNSGKIGLDYNQDYKNYDWAKDSLSEEQVAKYGRFETITLPHNLSINGIDSLNCQIEFKAKTNRLGLI